MVDHGMVAAIVKIKGRTTLAEIAQELGLSERYTKTWLIGCINLGLVERRQERVNGRARSVYYPIERDLSLRE